MRIVQLTPGTGNFYCGSCLRDHALVEALRRIGHEVIMVPLYLPHVVDTPDETNTSPIFFGGVNVYLEQKLALFRHTPHWIDRLLNTRRLLAWAASRAGMTSARDLGELTVSMLEGEHGRQNKEITQLITWLKTRGQIDVICLSNALLLGMARRLRDELNARVVTTLAGEDAFLDTLVEPYRRQAWDTLQARAADAHGFVAVSRYYADVMRRRLALPEDDARVHVVYNGIDLTGYDAVETPPADPTIGFLARLHEGKGLATLVDAFILLKQRDRVPNLRLKIAGAMTHADRTFVELQRRKLVDAGLASHVTMSANLTRDEKLKFLHSLSVFSVPATYGEAFGLYVLEALACAVPVVQPRHGAFTELIDQLGGGVLCEPDDPIALADALEIVLLRHDESRRLAADARQRVHEHFNVDRMAREVAAVFEHAASHAGEEDSPRRTRRATEKDTERETDETTRSGANGK